MHPPATVLLGTSLILTLTAFTRADEIQPTALVATTPREFAVWSAAHFTDAGQKIVAGFSDHRGIGVAIWDARSLKSVKEILFTKQQLGTGVVQASPDGKRLAACVWRYPHRSSGDGDQKPRGPDLGFVNIIDSASGVIEGSLEPPEGALPYGAVWSPDSKRLVLCHSQKFGLA